MTEKTNASRNKQNSTTTTRNNTALPWAIAALATGLTIGYFLCKPKQPSYAPNVRMQQEVTIQNSYENTTTNNTTARPYEQNEAVPNQNQITRPSTPARQQNRQSTATSRQQTINDIVDEKISPEDMQRMEQNTGLINEWKSVKKYDTQERQPNVVDHHYKTRGIKKSSPCDYNLR